MCVVLVSLATFALSNEVYDIFFYVIEMAVSLYSLYYIYYTRVAIFLGVMVSSDIIPHLFFRYIKFFFRY